MAKSAIVQRAETPMLFVRAIGGTAGAPAAFERLEVALGGPHGRKFWGWIFDREYRACAVRKDGDDAKALGLDEGTLSAGAYARRRHEGPPHEMHQAFAVLQRDHAVDATRPDLEEYRRAGEAYALLPIRT